MSTTPQTLSDDEIDALWGTIEDMYSGSGGIARRRYFARALLAQRAQAGGEAVALARSRVGRVYLAGPMTGYADYNFPAFNAAAERLRAEGFDVVNPADHGVIEGAEWSDYLRYDLAKLAGCESIALLPGWEASKGARLEVHIAQALGFVIRCLDGAASPNPAQQAVPVGEREKFEAWDGLKDSDWVNIVNAPAVLSETNPEDAVRVAVKLTENRLRELNARASLATPSALEKDAERNDSLLVHTLELIRDWPVREQDYMQAANMRKLAHDTLNALATPTPASASTWAVREFDIEQIVDVAMFGDRGNRIDLFNRINEILKGRSL